MLTPIIGRTGRPAASSGIPEDVAGTPCGCVDGVCPAGMTPHLHPLASLLLLPVSDDDSLGRNPNVGCPGLSPWHFWSDSKEDVY